MHKYLVYMLFGLFMIPVSGCQSDRPMISEGNLSSVLAGSEINRYMDTTDEMQAQLALEYNQDRQARKWQNDNTGARFITTPTSTYRNVSGQNCRAFQTEIFVDNKKESARGTACRQPDDGTWKLMR
ncbi:RT0821/Lpp0805 family surface protein [Mariprofundus ferrooxydans]|uniref:17 kDa surface antigen n=1 Tax=Mariprofundus ferrooxydans PV-1 TaxID=314345 RepID=Q0EXE5_9PROT|nr:RT0821/Lpp0805 family surface protein [Mariprofundus ferrooxydans]EAU53971.1 17 kDa surface antigen precursor [Mariprofundus ferrooxydans PV-1]KON47082.1 hypothetical protein AL013_09740 [Mariprofundus ferrooxydans]